MSSKPERALILRIDTPLAIEMSEFCSASCEKNGMPFEYFEGYQEGDMDKLFNELLPFRVPAFKRMRKGPGSCTAGHLAMWYKVMEDGITTVIYEHDAVQLHPIDLEIPDGYIVCLGYKFYEYQKYDWEAAGPPKRIYRVANHHGSHAYAITPKTAEMLVREMEAVGPITDIDSMHFMPGRRSKIPLAMMEPTPAIAWLRQSTIWDGSASVNNFAEMPHSFKAHLTGPIR